MATSAGAVIAAVAARARREVREHFEQRDAFDPARAVEYDPPDRMHQRQFEMLVGRGILRETMEGRYWIDREAARLEGERRQAAMKAALIFIVIAIVIAIAVTAVLAR